MHFHSSWTSRSPPLALQASGTVCLQAGLQAPARHHISDQGSPLLVIKYLLDSLIHVDDSVLARTLSVPHRRHVHCRPLRTRERVHVLPSRESMVMTCRGTSEGGSSSDSVWPLWLSPSASGWSSSSAAPKRKRAGVERGRLLDATATATVAAALTSSGLLHDPSCT